MRGVGVLGLCSSLAVCALVACSSDADDDGTTTTSSPTEPSGSISGGGTAASVADDATDAGAPAPITYAFHGTLTSDAPKQTGFFSANDGRGPAPSCTKPAPARPVIGADAEVHYDAHTFHNTTGAGACVTVQFKVDSFPSGGSGGLPEFIAYVGAFDATDITIDYAAGMAGVRTGQFSFNVPAGAPFAVVVAAPVTHEVLATSDAPPLSRAYSLNVTGY